MHFYFMITQCILFYSVQSILFVFTKYELAQKIWLYVFHVFGQWKIFVCKQDHWSRRTNCLFCEIFKLTEVIVLKSYFTFWFIISNKFSKFTSIQTINFIHEINHWKDLFSTAMHEYLAKVKTFSKKKRLFVCWLFFYRHKSPKINKLDYIKCG